MEPPKSKRFIAKTKAETLPPEISTSLAAASAVPPVAIKSSIIKIESFLPDKCLVSNSYKDLFSSLKKNKKQF